MIWNPVYIFLALKDQMPLKRFLRNFFVTGNGRGLFHKRSHFRDNGKTKVGLRTKTRALEVAKKLGEKYDTHFSVYRCMYCGRYHLGKNRDNK